MRYTCGYMLMICYTALQSTDTCFLDLINPLLFVYPILVLYYTFIGLVISGKHVLLRRNERHC